MYQIIKAFMALVLVQVNSELEKGERNHVDLAIIFRLLCETSGFFPEKIHTQTQFGTYIQLTGPFPEIPKRQGGKVNNSDIEC